MPRSNEKFVVAVIPGSETPAVSRTFGSTLPPHPVRVVATANVAATHKGLFICSSSSVRAAVDCARRGFHEPEGTGGNWRALCAGHGPFRQDLSPRPRDSLAYRALRLLPEMRPRTPAH